MVGISVASASAIEGWCQSGGIEYPMVADPNHDVSEAYGVYDLLGDGHAAPSMMIVDVDGSIVWSHVSWPSSERLGVSTILEQLPR